MEEIAVLEEEMKELRQKLGDVEAEINKVTYFIAFKSLLAHFTFFKGCVRNAKNRDKK